MKRLRLPSRKALRRTGWTLATLASLTVLGYAALNWHGARLKRDALARLRSGGVLLDSGVLPVIPPDDRNFAAIPLLRETSVPGDPDDFVSAELKSVDPRLEPLYQRDFEKIRAPLSPDPDFSRLPEKSPYGRSAAGFLESYDRLNASALAELRAALLRPESQRPLNLVNASAPDYDAMDLHGGRIRSAMNGLRLRALAAIEVRDAPRAVESIALWHRLAEVLCSRGTLLPVMAEGRLPLRRGIDAHLFSRADLLSLQEIFRRPAYREKTLASLRLSALSFQRWSQWKERPASYSRVFSSFVDADSPLVWHWLQCHASLLPAGFFDISAALWADEMSALVKAVEAPGPIAGWWTLARRPQPGWENWQWSHELWLPRGIVTRGAQGLVAQSLNLLACDLEAYRLAHGAYPESLDALEGAATLDPLNGQPFRYSREGGSFRLYSIGPDGIDQGGKSDVIGGWWGGADWVW